MPSSTPTLLIVERNQRRGRSLSITDHSELEIVGPAVVERFVRAAASTMPSVPALGPVTDGRPSSATEY
jgi:hypothetical protein